MYTNHFISQTQELLEFKPRFAKYENTAQGIDCTALLFLIYALSLLHTLVHRRTIFSTKEYLFSLRVQ